MWIFERFVKTCLFTICIRICTVDQRGFKFLEWSLAKRFHAYPCRERQTPTHPDGEIVKTSKLLENESLKIWQTFSYLRHNLSFWTFWEISEKFRKTSPKYNENYNCSQSFQNFTKFWISFKFTRKRGKIWVVTYLVLS